MSVSVSIVCAVIIISTAEYCAECAEQRLKKSVLCSCRKLLLLRAGSWSISGRVPDRRVCNSEGSTTEGILSR